MTPPTTAKRIIIGITGASGACYADRLIECLIESGVNIDLVVSSHGRRLLVEELGVEEITALLGRREDRLVVHDYDDVGAVIASGSTQTDGMVVCPCSCNTLAKIATGTADNLLTRAAAVTLKERRRLVLVNREMPLSHIDLRNCLSLSEAGAVICPACPGFYMRPSSINDLIDFVVGRVLDLLNVPHKLATRWGDVAGNNDQEVSGS